jgi:hypothetical protein
VAPRFEVRRDFEDVTCDGSLQHVGGPPPSLSQEFMPGLVHYLVDGREDFERLYAAEVSDGLGTTI